MPFLIRAGALTTLAASAAFAQLQIVPNNNAQSLAAAFAGNGVTIVPGSATLVGDAGQQSQFTATDASLIGFTSGVLLSSGQASNVLGPNTTNGITFEGTTGSDPDLETLTAGDIIDANVLSFSFTVPAGTLPSFRYVFASEEYNEFVGSHFNDVFGFFVDGTNVALTPGTTTAVAINSVNGGDPDTAASNAQFYRNNDPFVADANGNIVDQEDLLDTQADGLTTVLTADVAAALNPNLSVHTIKLAIGDNNDNLFDSWVFLEAGSFSVPEPGVLGLPSLAALTTLRRRRV